MSIKRLPVVIITTIVDCGLFAGTVFFLNRSSRLYKRGNLKAKDPLILFSKVIAIISFGIILINHHINHMRLSI